MNNTQIRAFVRQLINEAKDVKKSKKVVKTSVGDRLKMIDEAGDKAALQAKIAKIDEDIKEAHEIKSAIPENIGHFVDHEIIGDLHDDLAKSIEELQAKKAELEAQMKDADKPVKEARFKKGTDIGKKGPGFAKIEKSAAKHYGSEEAGKKVAGAILKKVVKK
jgi:methyl-accepting chemotaxis protein